MSEYRPSEQIKSEKIQQGIQRGEIINSKK